MWIASNKQLCCPAHIKALNLKLMEVAAGECRRLIVTMPPRHGKSEMISHYFPAWFLGNFPKKRIILTSYEASFAASWGRKARQVLTESSEVFGVGISGDSTAADWWETEYGGSMNTAGVGGAITGKGADVLIIDDPIKNAEEAASSTIRDKCVEWFKSTAYTRLEPRGAIILVMTRWHEADLAGYLLEEAEKGGEKWEHLNLPALAFAGDIMGRAEGDPLWPARFDSARLNKIKETLGEFWFSALYQQNPVPAGGLIFKRDWFNEFSDMPQGGRRIWSWDTAVKTGQENDYSAGVLLNETKNGIYIERVIHERVEYPELKRLMLDSFSASRSSAVVVEDKSSGQQFLQEMQRTSRLPVIAVQPIADKVSRARLATPTFESGKIFIPEKADWKSAYVSEFLNFPRAKHDDMVDATVQGINYLNNKMVLDISAILVGGKRDY